MRFDPIALQLAHSRRNFLARCGGGVGIAALAQLFAKDGLGASQRPLPATNALEPKPAQFDPKAKSVIFLFMEGGPSQIDLFDPKPQMQKWNGQSLPDSMRKNLRFAFIKPTAKVWASPRKFGRYGQSGMEFSDWLPHLSKNADELCMVRSLQSDQFNHHPGQLLLHCGSPLVGRPSMGSWSLYGLGSESQNLPGFVVLNSGGRGSFGSSGLFGSGFLPSMYQGVPFAARGDPIPYLSNPKGFSAQDQRARVDVIRKMNERHFHETGDAEIASRIAAYELAFRMQSAAPELLDLKQESASTLEMYGAETEPTRAFALNCILARRLVERGVRFVLLIHTSWDDHSNLLAGHEKNCLATDKPSAALVRDLKERGMLDQTLVAWGGEFGRTPLAQTLQPGNEGATGRDHHPDAFTMWLAGGGMKRGQVVGRTDDLGMSVVEDKVHIHDLHATMLHCLGLDHKRLTYRHQGRDFRLTDVAGEVVSRMLA
jgi:hypothetical protein